MAITLFRGQLSAIILQVHFAVLFPDPCQLPPVSCAELAEPEPVVSLSNHGGERGIRTLGIAFDDTRDFQSRPFGLSGISPFIQESVFRDQLSAIIRQVNEPFFFLIPVN